MFGSSRLIHRGDFLGFVVSLTLVATVLAVPGGVSAQTPLATPVVSSAVQSGESVVFGWNAIADRNEYHVQWFFPSGHNVYDATQSTSFTIDTQGIAGDFCLEVRAVSPGRDSELSNRLCATVTNQLATPVLSSAVQSGESVVFGWNAIADRNEYHVQWFFPSGHNVYDATQNTSFAIDTEGIAGDFCLEVRAVSPGRDSELSNRLCTTVVADAVAPSRPGWSPPASGYYTGTDSTVTMRWGNSTDNMGVTGFKVQLGNAETVTVDATTRSHTFTNVAPGRYYVRTYALDAAGNQSPPRGHYYRVLSAADQTATANTVAAITEAIEAFVADGNDFADLGGYNGTGWFNYSNGTSYPTKISDNLINGGYLASGTGVATYYDYMIYHCGTGDQQYAAVFTYWPGNATPLPTGANTWTGCTKTPLYYAHHGYTTTATLHDLQAADTEAPSRPSWGNSYWAAGPDAIFVSWGEATDNVGVTGYRLLLGSDVDVTLSRWSSSYIFPDLEPGRHLVRVAAVDAAGNVGTYLSVWLRVDTAAERARHRDAVAEITAALEEYAAIHGTYRVDGGAWGNGTGWFNLSNGSSYPNRISQALIDEGLLDDAYASGPYGHYMVYVCGSGDSERVGVFTEDGGTDASSSSAAAWTGCTQTPRYYGKNYFQVSAELGDLLAGDSQAPSAVHPTSPESTHDTIVISWTSASDNVAVTGYEVAVDGDVVAQLGATASEYVITGLERATLYPVHVVALDAAGNRSTPIPVTMATAALVPLPVIDPIVEWTTATSIRLSWTVPDSDADLEALGIFLNGESVIWIPPTETSFTIAEWSVDEPLTADTIYNVGVFAVELDYTPRTTSGEVIVRTAPGDLPTTTPGNPSVPPTDPEPTDTSPPTWINPRANDVLSSGNHATSRLYFKWTGHSDLFGEGPSSGIKEYEISLNGNVRTISKGEYDDSLVEIGSPTGFSHIDEDKVHSWVAVPGPGTYDVGVRIVDNANNKSQVATFRLTFDEDSSGSTVTGTPSGPEVTAPVVPPTPPIPVEPPPSGIPAPLEGGIWGCSGEDFEDFQPRRGSSFIGVSWSNEPAGNQTIYWTAVYNDQGDFWGGGTRYVPDVEFDLLRNKSYTIIIQAVTPNDEFLGECRFIWSTTDEPAFVNVEFPPTCTATVTPGFHTIDVSWPAATPPAELKEYMVLVRNDDRELVYIKPVEAHLTSVNLRGPGFHGFESGETYFVEVLAYDKEDETFTRCGDSRVSVRTLEFDTDSAQSWAVCGGASAAWGFGVSGDGCLWVNSSGDAAFITSMQFSAGFQAGGGGFAAIGYADTSDFSAIGGLSLCANASISLGGGINASTCNGHTGGFSFSGARVHFVGVSSGAGGALSVGLSGGSVDVLGDGARVTAIDHVCTQARALGLPGPPFCP